MSLTSKEYSQRHRTYMQAAYPAWINEDPRQMKAYRDVMQKAERRVFSTMAALAVAVPVLSLMLFAILTAFGG